MFLEKRKFRNRQHCGHSEHLVTLFKLEDAALREEAISEVGLDDTQRVFIRPEEGDFEHIYRAAMEVYWDRQSRRLSHPRPPRDWTPVQWFEQIIAAVADEYGVRLRLTSETVWNGVSQELRSAMEAAAQVNGR